MKIQVLDSKRVRIVASPGDDIEIQHATENTLADRIDTVMRGIGARRVDYTHTGADKELIKRLRFTLER